MTKLYQISSTLFALLLLAMTSWGQITFDIEMPSCPDEEDGKVTVNVNNGKAPYMYSKDGGGFQASNIFENLKAGSYEITVKDDNDCEGKGTAEVEDPPDQFNVSISGGGNRTICQGDPVEVTLSASTSCGDCTLTWSTGATGNSITVNSGGSYSVTASKPDADCDETESTTVNIDIKDCDDDDDDDIDIPILHAVDPNDIIGPEGYGPERWVSVNEVLPYTIRFENDPTYATAPAQKVIITHPIDSTANIYSLRLGSFGFGAFNFNVPPNSTYYYNRLDVIDSLGVLVDITAGFDIVKHEAFWIFESIDPNTGLPPDDALLGFLPVNDTSVTRFNDTIPKQGEGFVSFNIAPKATAQTGDTIHAVASIVFDINEPIITPSIFNIVDAYPPVSQVDMLLATMPIPSLLTWSGADDAGGCGIAFYDLYVSEDGGPFIEYETNIADTTYLFTGTDGVTYDFFTRATDNVGNQEPLKFISEATATAQARHEFDLQVFLEGPYLGNDSMHTDLVTFNLLPMVQPYNVAPWNYQGVETLVDVPNDMVDWVLITIRRGTSNTTIVDTIAGILRNDGQILGTDGELLSSDFPINPTDSFHIAVYHRNHIGVMTNGAIEKDGTGIFSFNFTTDPSQLYGAALGVKDLGNSRIGMLGGDFNANGQVQNTDYNEQLMEIGLPGYLQGDLNLNSQVQNTDLQGILLPNIGRGAAFEY